MSELVKREIEKYFEDRCKYLYEKIKIKVSFSKNDSHCVIHLEKMYEGIAEFTSFKDLTWISNLLGTEEINLKNNSFSGGCETCDYGSSDEVDIVCFKVKLKDTQYE